jgi:type IV secretory pathway TraG/TraD family ATPase VirD4
MIITAAHGEAQLRQRWGADGARIIGDTSGAKIWLPGISDPATLETASTLCGTAAYREHGEQWTSRQPVMTPDMIRQLPAGRALVIRGGCSPAIAKLPMAWHDPHYRRARRTWQATEPEAHLESAWQSGEITSSDPLPGTGTTGRSFGSNHPWAPADDPWDEEPGPA